MRDRRREGERSDLASGSSRESRFSQRVEIMLSYWLGYLRNMSCNKTQTTPHYSTLTVTHAAIDIGTDEMSY